MNKEPKTQGKIDWKNKLNELGFIHPPLHKFIENLIRQQQSALLQRVIELIGEDEDGRDWDTGARNTFRKELKTKISQMVKEL